MRAVIFDFFGTLNDPAAERERGDVFTATAAVLGIAAERFWAEMSGSFGERITGVHGGTRDTLRTMAQRCGVTPSDDLLDRAVTVHLAESARLHRPRDGALALLDVLRDKGFKLGLISDCSSELYERWPQTPYAARIDAPVFSWEHGFRKPDQRLYSAAARALGVPNEQCLYVGDGSGREHFGANAAGMTPVLVTNAAVPGADQHRVDPDEFIPDRVIDDLNELTALLA